MICAPWRTHAIGRARRWSSGHRVRSSLPDRLRALAVGRTPVSILELGSGPGFLARHLLSALPVSKYVALDFSLAMHELARTQPGALVNQVEFVQADFTTANWAEGFPRVNAVVMMQAVHELRHKRHAPQFYRTVRPLVTRDGMLLMCDHFAGADGMSNRELFMSPEEHAAALRDGGFASVELLLQRGGLVLFRARDAASTALAADDGWCHPDAPS